MELKNLKAKQYFYTMLDERSRRHFAGIEAQELGHGGIKVASKAFDINPTTVRKGIREINDEKSFPLDRIRKQGGGRKKKTLLK